MSARDDYRILAEAAVSGSRASVNAHELAAALDEIDRLRTIAGVAESWLDWRRDFGAPWNTPESLLRIALCASVDDD